MTIGDQNAYNATPGGVAQINAASQAAHDASASASAAAQAAADRYKTDAEARSAANAQANQLAITGAQIGATRQNLQTQLAADLATRREQLVSQSLNALRTFQADQAARASLPDPTKPTAPNLETTRLGAEAGATGFARGTGSQAGGLAASFARNRITSEAASNVSGQQKQYNDDTVQYENAMAARARGQSAFTTLGADLSKDYKASKKLLADTTNPHLTPSQQNAAKVASFQSNHGY